MGTTSSNLATVTITVRPRPTAGPDSYSTPQDTPLAVTAPTGVLANDTSGSGGPLTARLVGSPTHGTVSLNADGSFTYAPAAGYSGPDAFTYTANDGGFDSLPATVSLTVTPKPPPPTANPDAYSTGQDTPLTVTAPTGVLANDAVGGGGALTAAVVGGPAHGTLTLNPDGSFSYNPTAGYNGPDAFTYAATNSAGSAQATVSLTVTAPPPPPTATADDYTVDQDTALIVTAAEGVLANDVSGSGGPLTAAPVSDPMHGTLTLNANGSFTYTPVAGYNGPDTFRYRASDGAGSAQADVAIEVRPPQPVVTPPTANPDRYATGQGTPLTVTAATGVLANYIGSCPDGRGGHQSDARHAGVERGRLVPLHTDGRLRRPRRVHIGGGQQRRQRAGDRHTDRPHAAGAAADRQRGQLQHRAEHAADRRRRFRGARQRHRSRPDRHRGHRPRYGTLVLDTDGSFSYTPAAGYVGPDAFSYAATNSAGSAGATVTLAVLPPPLPPPIAADDVTTRSPDTPLTVATATGVLANDSGAVTAAVVAARARDADPADRRFVHLHARGRLHRAGYVRL